MPLMLQRLVDTSTAVAATPARTAKVAALAALIAAAEPAEVEAVVAFATGEARQGRIGIGWATAFGASAASATPAPGAGPVPATASATAVDPPLTVADLDAALGRLAALSGPGSVAARQAMLAELFARATAGEADWLRRLLVGELRQGALAGVVADAVAKAAGVPLAAIRRAAMLAGNLPEVAALALAGGERALAAVGLDVGRPVLPMLASTATDVAAALAVTGPASVEWKLDGARIQAHKRGDDVRLFTRNLNDVTDRLPGVAAIVRGLPAVDLVLDGEVIGFDENARPDRFQDTMSRFGRHDGSGAALAVAFFDCMLADGVTLIDRTFVERAEVLERVAGPWRVRSIVTADPVAAADFLAASLASGHEGVMVKAVGSRYEAGRRGKAWLKVKPVLTLDLVVLAAEWGHGRRRGWLSNLHLGARDGDGFAMVGKTFKGLTDELLAWQTGRLQELATREDGYVVHVRPELVVEVAIDGVQVSRRYPGGVALRFARVRRYRDDKGPADADSIDAVRALLSRSGPSAGDG